MTITETVGRSLKCFFLLHLSWRTSGSELKCERRFWFLKNPTVNQQTHRFGEILSLMTAEKPSSLKLCLSRPISSASVSTVGLPCSPESFELEISPKIWIFRCLTRTNSFHFKINTLIVMPIDSLVCISQNFDWCDNFFWNYVTALVIGKEVFVQNERVHCNHKESKTFVAFLLKLSW